MFALQRVRAGGFLKTFFLVLRVSRKLLNRFCWSNPSSGLKSQILPRAKYARFLGRALLATAEPWARRVPPRGWWPSGRASVSEAGGSRARFLPGARFALSRRALRKLSFQVSVFPASFLLECKFAFWVRGSCQRVGRGPQWPSGRASVSEAGGAGPVVVSGCRNAVCGRAVVFYSGNQESAAAFRHQYFCGRNALGFARRRTSKLVGVLHLS